jgi:hypothetical protein
MEEVIIADDDIAALRLLRDVNGVDFVIGGDEISPDAKYPRMVARSPHLAAFAAYFGSVKCVKLFVNLSFNRGYVDEYGRTMGCYAAAGGSFEICREFQNLGVSFGATAHNYWPAQFAAEFGRLDVLQWLWTLGYCPAEAQWVCLREGIRAGQTAVVEFLLDEEACNVRGSARGEPNGDEMFSGLEDSAAPTASAFAAAVWLAASLGSVGFVKALVEAGARPFGAAAAAAFGGFVEIAESIVDEFPDELERWVQRSECWKLGALKFGLTPLEGFVAGGFAIPSRFESLAPGVWREGQVRAIVTSQDSATAAMLERLVELKGREGFMEIAF